MSLQIPIRNEDQLSITRENHKLLPSTTSMNTSTQPDASSFDWGDPTVSVPLPPAHNRPPLVPAPLGKLEFTPVGLTMSAAMSGSAFPSSIACGTGIWQQTLGFLLQVHPRTAPMVLLSLTNSSRSTGTCMILSPAGRQGRQRGPSSVTSAGASCSTWSAAFCTTLSVYLTTVDYLGYEAGSRNSWDYLHCPCQRCLANRRTIGS